MKNFLLIILSLFFAVNVCGCDFKSDNIISDSDQSSDVSSEEGSYVSEESSIEESSDESSVAIETIYEFLLSEYVVTSTRESFGTTYTSDYYFVMGKVVGVRLTTTLIDESAAEEYYEIIIDDFPDTSIEHTTVTHYMEDEHSYYGYTLDKLKFMLQKSGYEYTVNFDEDAYNAEFTVSKSS